MTPIPHKPLDAGSHDQQMTPAVQAVIDAADKRMPAGCTTPDRCRQHGCHGACLPHDMTPAETAIREALAEKERAVLVGKVALADLLAELDGERNRSQMYADLVRGVAVVLRGEGWSDTSKLPQEVAALKADAERYRLLRNASMDERNRLEHYAGPALDAAIDAAKGGGNG